MSNSTDSQPRILATRRLVDFRAHEMSYDSDSAMPSHAHEETSIVFILKGSVQHTCRDRSSLLTTAMLTFIPAGEPHANHFCRGLKTFDIVLQPQWIKHVRQYSELPDQAVIHQNNQCTWLATRLYREFHQRDNLMPLMMEGLLLELIVYLSRDMATSVETQVPRWLKQARDYLHAHFTESLSMDTIAEAVGVHPSHLMHGFRQHYHSTLGNYIRGLRVDYATRLIATSDLTLGQIALAAGFADQSHFCRTFKQYTGLTPAQFQKGAGDSIFRQKTPF